MNKQRNTTRDDDGPEQELNRHSGIKCYKEWEPYVFISYAHSDIAEIEKTLSVMTRRGVRYWYDEGIMSGSEWEDVIAERITKCSIFLCFISPEAVESPNVKDEVHLAKKRRCNILTVYLKKTELSGGMELILDRWQHLFKYQYSQAMFEEKLFDALGFEVVEKLEENENGQSGERAGHYRIIREVGLGGTSAVFTAENTHTGKIVAIKQSRVEKQLIQKLFEQERNALVRLDYPFVPNILDYFSKDGRIWMVESYIDGPTLDKVFFSSRKEIVEAILQVAEILQSCHNKGIVHCDVKPSNVVIKEGHCYLIDFGSAYLSYEKETEQYHAMGTVGYAAPEQYANDSSTGKDGPAILIDSRTDIYGLGKTMLRLLAAYDNKEGTISSNGTVLVGFTRALFNEYSFIPKAETTAQESTNADENLFRPVWSMGPLFKAINDKMIRKKKTERFDNMGEVIQALKQYLRIIEDDPKYSVGRD